MKGCAEVKRLAAVSKWRWNEGSGKATTELWSLFFSYFLWRRKESKQPRDFEA